VAIEIRRLILNEEELTQICAEYIADGDVDGLNGTMMDLKIVKDDPFEISLRVHSAEGQQIPFTMGETQLVAALLSFCARKNIPISRSSKKTVKKNDKGMIIFDMVMQSSV